ncbi:MAG: hypothetical protein P1V97_14125 [Planctomycetota bacterium]|nr:hypothetical protein [Planctomycetota bacterium]
MSSISISIHCTECSRRRKYGLFKKEKGEECLGCNGRDWTITGTITNTFRESSYTRENAATNLTGAALLVGVGIGFSSGSETQESERDFEFSGLKNDKILEIMSASKNRKIELILELVAERNAEYLAAMDSLIETEGAHCFACRKGFLPGIVLARLGLLKDGVFTRNNVCSGRCLRIYEQNCPKNHCKSCKKAFKRPEKPTDPVMARRWKPRPFFEAGYCSNNCHKNADKKRCLHCGKAYQISKVDYLPKHKEIIAAQENGFCSLKCDSIGEKVTAPGAAATEESNSIQAECESQHIFDIPKSHIGFIAICPDCQARVQIEAD